MVQSLQFTSAKQNDDVFPGSKKGDLILLTPSKGNIFLGSRDDENATGILIKDGMIDLARPINTNQTMFTSQDVILREGARLGVGLGSEESPNEKIHVEGNTYVNGNSYIMNRVGINTQNPDDDVELDVNGSVKVRDEFFLLSDRRQKENIQPIKNALSKTESLEGVSYNRKDVENKDKIFMGFIAQDVKQIIPEAVNYNNTKDEYSLNYINLIALCVESIKDLSGQNQELKKRVNDLERAVNANRCV